MKTVNEMKRHIQKGVSLIELMVAIAILGIVASLAASVYTEYTLSANVSKAIQEIRMIGLLVTEFQRSTRGNPADLSIVGVSNKDPWGRDYQYLDVTITANAGQARMDNGTPINTDFDLYSMGPDGDSAVSLTNPQSQDDVIRASNGRYVGTVNGF